MSGIIDVDNNSSVVNNNSDVRNNDRTSIASSDTSSAIVLRSKISTLLRPSSLVSRVSRRKSKSSVLDSVSCTDNDQSPESPVNVNTKKTEPKGWNTIVTVVLVGAKDLLDPPDDGNSHNLYCKFRLGSETYKSKGVANTSHPEWKERFELHLYKDHLLRLSLWDKGKQKNFMGSAVVDLASLEKERTHQIWQELDDGFGTVHCSITMCKVRDSAPGRTSSLDEGVVVKAKHDFGFSFKRIFNLINLVYEHIYEHILYKMRLFTGSIFNRKQKNWMPQKPKAINDLKTDWNLVGQLYVKVIGAKGLSGKPNAYCTLELDNERVQTHSSRASSEPHWDKSYVFNVFDVTSTLDLKVYDSSLVTALRSESLGRISIPLLRINNGECRWFALKGRNSRDSAKGNCPRVQLEMTIFWNPVKATVRLFKPKEVKYLKKPPKFDVALIYSNLQFVRDTFNVLVDLNEQYKRLFEWDNKELSFTALVGWLLFWFYFRLWATPLLLLIPFFYYWITQSKPQERSSSRTVSSMGDESPDSDNDKAEKGLTGKIQGLPELTLTITGGVEYTVSIAERLYNLASFKVPFLSFLTMIFLVFSAAGFYFIPFNYMMMAFGVYKFSRKYFNPERTLNNDLLDFISRIPDNEIWKDWKELRVPEPSHKRRQASLNRRISDSSS